MMHPQPGKQMGSTYTIESKGDIVFKLELEEPIDPSKIKYISAFSLQYEFDEDGYIVAHNARVTYRRHDGGINKRYQSIDGELTRGGNKLINLLCCGDINYSYKNKSSIVACPDNIEQEELFEMLLLDFYNEVFYN